MRQTLLSNWNLIRWVRLILGVAIVIQSAMLKDGWFTFLGLTLSAMALFNIGCCGTGSCYVPVKKKNTDDTIQYEEIQ